MNATSLLFMDWSSIFMKIIAPKIHKISDPSNSGDYPESLGPASWATACPATLLNPKPSTFKLKPQTLNPVPPKWGLNDKS